MSRKGVRISDLTLRAQTGFPIKLRMTKKKIRGITKKEVRGIRE